MSDEPTAERGDVVGYLDASGPDNAEFRYVVVAGVGVADPPVSSMRCHPSTTHCAPWSRRIRAEDWPLCSVA